MYLIINKNEFFHDLRQFRNTLIRLGLIISSEHPLLHYDLYWWTMGVNSDEY